MKYYSLKRILAKDCTYNVIFGERSNGKTYSVLKYGVEQYFKTGGQLAIVRRWKEDITGRRASDIFSALIANDEINTLSGGNFTGVYYWGGKFFLCNYDEKGKVIYNDSDCFAYVFALSDTEHNKSISYPKVTTVLFDEFITKLVYLNDEFVLFMNTLSTIVRQRANVKIFMLGNTVNKFCPYFAEMGLNHVLKMEQGAIDVYTYGNSDLKVAVEYCNNNKSKENNFYFAFNNPKLHMITDGSWELDIYPHCPLKYKEKDIIFIYFIEFEEQLFQCEIVSRGTNYFTFIHRKTTGLKDLSNDIIYSLDYHAELNYNRNIYKPITQLQKRILWFYQTDRVFYQDNDVGNSINTYLTLCRGV
jgi:hypothetical protein